ncbi:enoyl-CoA hydratase/isomerase family protein [Piscibacillus halophilus]|uniref:enoyl-CoA hydratase/isomerase family protein n=1 Tax=Piscibacillus halophilus TaxID=571933 RepID=UPI00158987E6|nr:enoyl-CoA hydratase/isomerase family protein [Piscibacillus halophilus]
MGDSLLKVYPEQFAVLTLNRPHKLNAVSKTMIHELIEQINEIEQTHEMKFLIVTGSGNKAFCSGGDLNDFHGDLEEEEAYQTLKPMQEILYKIATLPVPTIAWLNGLARGGGLEIASACDFRFTVPEENFGFIQGKLGISTGWGGGTLLYRRVDPQLAFQWLIEADLKKSDELLKMGFVQKIVNDRSISSDNKLLEPYLNRSADQMRLWKSQRLKYIDLDQLKQQMDDEVRACSRLWVSNEHKQAVQQFLSKK